MLTDGVVLAFVLAFLAEVWGRIVPEVAIVDVAINCRRLCQAIACRQSSLKLPICLLAAYVCFICLGFFFSRPPPPPGSDLPSTEK